MPKILNPLLAQRELLAGSALVYQPDLAVVTVSGEDRLSWLHSLLSQNLKNLTPGQSTQSLLLDPHGHIEQLLNVIDDGQTTWIIVAGATKDALLSWLTRMVFRMRVVVADRSEDFAVVGSWGSALPAAEVTWVDGWNVTAAGGYRYGAVSTEPWSLHLGLVPLREFEAMEADSSVHWASEAALDALRIAAHRPGHTEVDEKSLPHELDLLASAVHLNKGCYRGQETVAKVHNLGHPPRRLVLLHLDGSGHLLPEVGDSVVLATDAAADLAASPGLIRGRVTSASQHHEMGPIALAVVARSVPIDAPLVVVGNHESIAATQEVIVPPEAGKVANVPRPSLLMGGRK
jgi:folate-binding protein YgfZ